MGAGQTLDKTIPKTLDKFSKFKIIKKKSYQKYFNKNGMWELEKNYCFSCKCELQFQLDYTIHLLKSLKL